MIKKCENCGIPVTVGVDGGYSSDDVPLCNTCGEELDKCLENQKAPSVREGSFTEEYGTGCPPGYIEVSSCPFCGDNQSTIEQDSFGKYYVRCPGCGVAGRRHYNRLSAVIWWNRRYTPPKKSVMPPALCSNDTIDIEGKAKGEGSVNAELLEAAEEVVNSDWYAGSYFRDALDKLKTIVTKAKGENNE